jgi:transcriptional regulator with XRE-family HTH domain
MPRKKQTNTRTAKEKTPAPPNRLREYRTARGWGVVDVAEFMGVDHSLVSLHETGKRRLTSDMVAKYAKLYCVERIELFNEIFDDGEVGEISQAGEAQSTETDRD